jgi:signal transduction histidine kinase
MSDKFAGDPPDLVARLAALEKENQALRQEIQSLRVTEEETARSLARIEVQRRLIQQREEERQQVARDLHDGPLQDFYSLVFTLKDAQDLCRVSAPYSGPES